MERTPIDKDLLEHLDTYAMFDFAGRGGLRLRVRMKVPRPWQPATSWDRGGSLRSARAGKRYGSSDHDWPHRPSSKAAAT